MVNCAMKEDIVGALEIVTRNVKNYIRCENVPNGILEDVNTIISSVKTDIPVDEPCVWIVQHPTIVHDEKKINLNGLQELQTTFEFICVEDDADLEEAEIKGLNLACRVGKCILKNLNMVQDNAEDPKHIFENVYLEAIYPVGEVSIEGKSKQVPATSIVFKFIYRVNWRKCRLPNTED